MNMDQVFIAVGNETRRTVLHELESRGTISYTQFKQILKISNDRSLNYHLSKLEEASLIRKSSYARGYELTEDGKRIWGLIKSLEQLPKKLRGPLVRVFLKGKVKGKWNFSGAIDILKRHPCMMLENVVEGGASFKLQENTSEISLEVREDGVLNVTGSIPIQRVLPLNNPEDIKDMERGFEFFYRLLPEGSEKSNEIKQGVPAWVLMVLAAIWSPVFFFCCSITDNGQSVKICDMKFQANLI